MKKQKRTRKRSAQGWAATLIITEMAVFTQETGYPFDDSRQIGNTS